MIPARAVLARNTKNAADNKNMQLKNLRKFIRKEDKRLRKQYGNYKDDEKRILARTVKLMEELGELSNEVLSYNSMQRKDKLDKYKANNLSEEFADVIITTFLLAEVLGVDVEKSLRQKIKKIDKRYNN